MSKNDLSDRYCPTCGAEVRNEDTFCPNCGQLLQGPADIPGEKRQAGKPGRGPEYRQPYAYLAEVHTPWAMALGGVVLFFVGLYFLLLGWTTGPVPIVVGAAILILGIWLFVQAFRTRVASL